MSRRGDRDSGTRRRPSLFDREPSPKRSKRDGKPVSERAPSDRNAGPNAEQNDKHRRRLQDPLPLEAPPSSDPKIETAPTSKDLQKKGQTNSEDAKASFNPSEVPRSRSYFQHDERSMAGSGGRGSSRRSSSDRGWWKDSKDQHVKASDRTKTDDTRKDDLSHKRDGETSAWRHDGFFEMEANPDLPPPPPLPAGRRRPSFREQKVPSDAQDVLHISKTDAVGPTSAGHPGERKEERSRYSNHWERPERRPNRRDDSRGGFASRERFGGGIRNMERDTYNGRQGNSRFSNDTPADKWKHDLYDEANKSLSPKKEEDRIAKIEALLAS